MEKPLTVLHLEDDPDFISLISAMLEEEGLRVAVSAVTTFNEFVSALDAHEFDIILADYSLPTCNGIQALQKAREKYPNTPFLLISGTIGEHAAIESLRCGATDYVLKSKLERLAPTVRRAVQEAEERKQRRRAETELVRREKYFRTLTENSLDVLTILSREGVFQYNSPSLKTVLGYDPSEVMGRNVFDLLHPDDLPGARAVFLRVVENPGFRLTQEFRARHRDGSWRYLEAIGRNRLDDLEISGVVLNLRDVSDRKRAEEKLRESERQYRLFFNSNPVPMWISSLSTFEFLEVNEAAVGLYGYSREEFLSKSTLDIRSAEESERLKRYVKANVINQRPASGIGHAGLWQHRKKSGELIDVEITWSIVSFNGSEALLTMANDVTERKRAAEALRKSEASLAAAQRIAHLGSWELNVALGDEIARSELQWSEETFRIFGYEPKSVEVSAELFFERVHPDDRQRIRETIEQALRKREIYDLEHRIVLSNGEERIVRERGEVVTDEQGNPVQIRGIVLDITERKRLEEQLRQSQKMEAIGQLAGGVAHDFNNILTVIHGHASLLLANENLPKSAMRSSQQITQAAERAAGLTRQLLTFSRRQVMQPRRLDLNEVVSNMTMMLGRILGEDITLQLNYWPQPAFVQADGSMIEQVLLNLAVNARDAMPKGGRLTIKIAAADQTAKRAGYNSEARPGKFVCLHVLDTGTGIAPEHLRHIFEPFFTTKEVGKGTGLGLATVYGIVKQHQGWIEVDSEPGKGAAFRVYLPASAEMVAFPENGQPAKTVVRGGNETILVVEDELAVRELVCSVLRSHGYKLLQAESGAKAMEVWRSEKEKIDLLLTDLVMPDRMNGRELAEKLRGDRPHLKVIFTSGYSADVVGKDFVLQRGLHYLQKPYDPQKLALAVRDCLDT